MTMRVFALLSFLPLTSCAGGAGKAGLLGDSAGGTPQLCTADADSGLEVGQCAPDFTLPDGAGEPFSLSSLRGKVALVDISAVW